MIRGSYRGTGSKKPTVVSRYAAEETIINSTYGIVKDAFEIEYEKRQERAEMKAAGSWGCPSCGQLFY